MFVNVYKMAGCAHYSRPHPTRESAHAGGRFLEAHTHGRYRYIQTVHVKPDESLIPYMTGGRTMCGTRHGKNLTTTMAQRREERRQPRSPGHGRDADQTAQATA